MKSLSDQELLLEYFERQSESAFAEFVRRHVDLVYSCALRILRDPHLAEDVTQTVFAAAARNARSLAEHPVVVGWLHRTTQNVAANIVRQEVRRRGREKAAVMNQSIAGDDAWESIEPHIEEALNTLRDQDREVVLLRFFQGKSAHEIGSVIGTSEEAAQKRLSRAVERIRKFLSSRGIGVGAASLGIVLSSHAVKAAPVGLADLISKGVIEAAVAHGITATAAQGIFMTTAQKAIVAASLALVMGTGVYEVHQSNKRRREAIASAQAPGEVNKQIQAMRRERDEAVADLKALRAEASRLKKEAEEVHRLRRDVAELRTQAAKIAGRRESGGIEPSETALIAWLNRTDLFKQAQYRLPDKSIPELALLTEEDWLQMAKQGEHEVGDTFQTDDSELNRRVLKTAREKAKMKFGFLLSGALDRYRKEHNDLLPSNVSLLRPYFQDREPHLGGSAEFVSDAMLQRYDVLQAGAFEDVPSEKAIILAEISPADAGLDTRLVIGKYWLKTAAEGDAGYWEDSTSSGRRTP